MGGGAGSGGRVPVKLLAIAEFMTGIDGGNMDWFKPVPGIARAVD